MARQSRVVSADRRILKRRRCVFAAAIAHRRGAEPNAMVGAAGWPVGAFAVVAGLLFVGKVGAGSYAGMTITANILMSLIIDKFGLFGMPPHALGVGRMIGAALMVGGIALISCF